MAKSYPDGFDIGLYLPTTEVFDVGDLEQAGIKNPRFQELLIRLAQRVNKINSVINYKTTGIYDEEEFINGNIFVDPASSTTTGSNAFNYAQEFRKMVYFGALPDGTVSTTKSVAHGITFDSAVIFTKRSVTATDSTNLLSIDIPYINVSGTVASNIEVYVDNTNVTITLSAAVDLSSFDNCIVILEYLKY
jgi:hypothetical protein